MFICGLDEIEKYRKLATHLISIADPDSDDEVPSLGLSMQNRLILNFHDLDNIEDAEIGFDGRKQIAPKESDVRKALAFAARLPSSESLLIHCHQGIRTGSGRKNTANRKLRNQDSDLSVQLCFRGSHSTTTLDGRL
jgi:predicted protein tyrosine phosphatase